MDKVIIDGVDVSECKYYDDGVCCNNDVMSISCENTDCIYKQLKRLEQENEKLKKELEKHKSMIAHNLKPLFDSDFQNKLKELEQENERLKKEVETWNYQADKRAELSNIWFNTAETYKQALQEIREIAKEQLQDVSDRCINTTPMYIVHKHIIDKINEVIGAEE